MNVERYLTIEEAALELANLTFDEDVLLADMSSQSIPMTSFNDLKKGVIKREQKKFNKMIMSAAIEGELEVRDPVNKLPYIPRMREYFVEVISVTDINDWLEKNGVDYRLDSNLALSQNKGRRNSQIQTITQQAKTFEYDLFSIPHGGKKKIKDACLKNNRLFTDSGFDHAWKEARKRKLIEVENVASYRKPT